MMTCPWPVQVRAAMRYGDLLSSADMVCSTAFDRDDEFFATAGVSRRIKVIDAYWLAIVTREPLMYSILADFSTQNTRKFSTDVEYES